MIVPDTLEKIRFLKGSEVDQLKNLFNPDQLDASLGGSKPDGQTAVPKIPM
jgi:hypothetical protein